MSGNPGLVDVRDQVAANGVHETTGAGGAASQR